MTKALTKQQTQHERLTNEGMVLIKYKLMQVIEYDILIDHIIRLVSSTYANILKYHIQGMPTNIILQVFI